MNESENQKEKPALVRFETWDRFPLSVYTCPKCGSPALEDNWPPNYGGGSMGGDISESHGSQKCVCYPCRAAFRVSFYVKQRWDKETFTYHTIKREVTYSETVDLLERDGFLLTPHDAWREDYKAEHGEYPVEVYA